MTPLTSFNGEHQQTQRIAIYGSTGSVGTQSLEVLKNEKEREVVALFAGSNSDLFAKQLIDFQPKFAGLADAESAKRAKEITAGKYRGQWLGEKEIIQFASSDEYDTQIAAIVGIEGFLSTFPAFTSGKKVALANKESLVVGGHYFRKAISQGGCGTLVPVDSEHSSLYRLLEKHRLQDINKLILTASGGPFLNYSEEQLQEVTLEQALKHPTWSMGPRITVDSATLMNKAYEFIEAYWLFDWNPKNIKIVVHPESLVHGAIELRDGSHMFHVSEPDMAYPIAYSLNCANFLKELNNGSPDFYPPMNFFPADTKRYPALSLALEVIEGGVPTALRVYTANETAALAFLEGNLPFHKIVSFISFALHEIELSSDVESEELFLAVQNERSKLVPLLRRYITECI